MTMPNYYNPTVTANVQSVLDKTGGFNRQDAQNYNIFNSLLEGQRMPGILSPENYRQMLNAIGSYVSEREDGVDLSKFMNTYVIPYLTQGGQDYRDAALDFWTKHKGAGGGDSNIYYDDYTRLTSSINDPHKRREWQVKLLMEALQDDADNMDAWKTAASLSRNLGSTMNPQAFNDYYNLANYVYAAYQMMNDEQKKRLAQAGVAVVDPGTYLPDLSSGGLSPLTLQTWQPYMDAYINAYGGGAMRSATGSGKAVLTPGAKVDMAQRAAAALKASGEGTVAQRANVPGSVPYGSIPLPNSILVNPAAVQAYAEQLIGPYANTVDGKGGVRSAATPTSIPAPAATKATDDPQVVAKANTKLNYQEQGKFNDFKNFVGAYKTPTEALNKIWGATGSAGTAILESFGAKVVEKVQNMLKLMRDQGDRWQWDVAK